MNLWEIRQSISKIALNKNKYAKRMMNWKSLPKKPLATQEYPVRSILNQKQSALLTLTKLLSQHCSQQGTNKILSKQQLQMEVKKGNHIKMIKLEWAQIKFMVSSRVIRDQDPSILIQDK